MIRWHLGPHLARTGWNANQLATHAGIGYPAAWRLVGQPDAVIERLDAALLEKLAAAFRVKRRPFSLLRYVPD